MPLSFFFFFFNDTATTEIYTLSLHDALPISNSFVGGIEAATWRRLNESESHPLFDRSIQARYPPGSTWKLAVAAIALKRGLVTFHSHMPIPCRGGLQYGNRFFRCWSAQGHGDLSLADAIAQSCDVFFYQLGLKIGLSSLLEEANGIGFHTRTGVDLPGEITPEFPTGTDRKSTRLNSSHDQISYAVFCLKKKKIRKQQCE